MSDLDEIERLALQATPGRWHELERCGNAGPDEACGIVSEATCCDVFKPSARWDRCPRHQHGAVTVFKSDGYCDCPDRIAKIRQEFGL